MNSDSKTAPKAVSTRHRRVLAGMGLSLPQNFKCLNCGFLRNDPLWLAASAPRFYFAITDYGELGVLCERCADVEGVRHRSFPPPQRSVAVSAREQLRAARRDAKWCAEHGFADPLARWRVPD